MNKEFVKFALIGFAATFCFAGQAPQSEKKQEKNQEIAMAKCSKSDPVCSEQYADESYCTGSGGCCKDAQGRPRRSAARKVVEGN
jgi:hypothetical protein